MRIGDWLLYAACVVLLAAAVLHGAGYGPVTGGLEKSGADAMRVGAFKALWLVLSVHYVLLSVVVFAASRLPGARKVLLLCALLPVGDAVLLFHFLGIFIGTIMTVVAAALLFAGGLLMEA